MAETKMCAHEGCKCLAKTDSKYCSTYCEEAGDRTEIMCDCGHPACVVV